MAALSQVSVSYNALYHIVAYINSLGILACLLIALIGMKLFWFKKRFNIDSTRNDEATTSNRPTERRQVMNRQMRFMPLQVNSNKNPKRNQQEQPPQQPPQFAEPVNAFGVFRRREENECESDIVPLSRLPPVRLPTNIRKKPSFFRALMQRSSQKALEIQTHRPVNISTPALPSLTHSEEINTNDNYQRATLPLMGPIMTTTANTEGTKESDVLLHASMDCLNRRGKYGDHDYCLDDDNALSLTLSLSSLSSVERCNSSISNFNIIEPQQQQQQQVKEEQTDDKHVVINMPTMKQEENDNLPSSSKQVVSPQKPPRRTLKVGHLLFEEPSAELAFLAYDDDNSSIDLAIDGDDHNGEMLWKRSAMMLSNLDEMPSTSKNCAFGKNIDEDWENFKKLIARALSPTPTPPRTPTSTPTNDDDDDEQLLPSVLNNDRKISRSNLKVTFDLEEQLMPNDCYFSEGLKSAENSPPPLPKSSPPIKTEIYYDEDQYTNRRRRSSENLISFVMRSPPPSPMPLVHHNLTEDNGERTTDA